MATHENIQCIPNYITPCAHSRDRIGKMLAGHKPVHPSRRFPPVKFQNCLDQAPRPIKSTFFHSCLNFHLPERQSGQGSSCLPVRPRVSQTLGCYASTEEGVQAQWYCSGGLTRLCSLLLLWPLHVLICLLYL